MSSTFSNNAFIPSVADIKILNVVIVNKADFLEIFILWRIWKFALLNWDCCLAFAAHKITLAVLLPSLLAAGNCSCGNIQKSTLLVHSLLSTQPTQLETRGAFNCQKPKYFPQGVETKGRPNEREGILDSYSPGEHKHDSKWMKMLLLEV